MKLLVLLDAENIHIHKGYKPTKYFVSQALQLPNSQVSYFASYRVTREYKVNKSFNDNIRVRHCDWGKDKADDILVAEATKYKSEGGLNICLVSNDQHLQRRIIEIFGEDRTYILNDALIKKYKSDAIRFIKMGQRKAA